MYMCVCVCKCVHWVSAKFDPPNIVKVVAVPKRLGCLQLHWTLSPEQSWMQIHRFILEVQIWTTDSGQQGERTVSGNQYPVDVNTAQSP